MTRLLSLPPELLVAVLKNLGPFDLESIAKTLNRTLYAAADPLLRPYRAWMQNARTMTSLFPPLSTRITTRLCPSYPGHLSPLDDDCVSLREEIARKDYVGLGLDPTRGPYIRNSPVDLRTWMKLDGTFEWLEPLDEFLADEMDPHTGREGDRQVAPDWQVDILVRQAGERGLKLPQGFETFLRSNRLHHRLPSYSAWYFQLSKLIRCPPNIDNDQGGYLCRFHFDQQSCAFGYLYLSLSGGHCVLVSHVDVYADLGQDDSIDESNDNQPAETTDAGPNGEGDESDDELVEQAREELQKKYFSVAGLSFEEYLVTVYFEGLLSFEAEPTKGLQDFVRHVYRSPLEIEHLREYNPAVKAYLDIQGWKGKEDYDQHHKD